MLYVLITVDVETSIGGAFAHPERLRPVGAEKRIYGRINLLTLVRFSQAWQYLP